MPLQASDIQQIGNQLAIRWSDGLESYLGLEELRRACPCAVCGGEPDLLDRGVHRSVEYSEQSFVLKTFAPVGGYALAFSWGDGHSTGIYSFAYLRQLASKPEE